MTNFFHKRSVWVLVLICCATFLIMVTVSFQESAIVDELAHIPAGYAYVHYLDYRLNPEHPPLLKALAAIPLLFLKLNYPLTNPFWTTAVNGEWGVGGAFLYGLGNSAAEIIQVARIVPMLFTIFLIVFTYFWARKLFGRVWALLPAFLLGLSPTIIAQGHYVTTDIAAAVGTIVGLYTFVTYMQHPTRKNLWLAGVGLGLAELMKFSTALLFIVIPLLMLAYYIATVRRDWYAEIAKGRPRFFLKRARTMIGGLIAIFAIAVVLVMYPVYGLFIARYPQARQISDAASIIGPLASGTCSVAHWDVCIAKATLWATHHELLRPLAEYAMGVLMVFERLTGTSASYFLGYVYQQGSLFYFPVTYGLKETIPALIIIVFGLAWGITRVIKAIIRKKVAFGRYIIERFPQFAMITFVLIYWGVSVMSPLNIGVRHLLPTIPLMYLLATSALVSWTGSLRASGTSLARYGIVLGILLVWATAETAFAYPYYTSYFNEFAGGTANGYRYITDSNYDWGQDMLRLQAWMKANPQVNKIALDFFGASNPQYYLGSAYVPWNSTMGDPASQGIQWFAVSINDLQLAIQPAAGSTSTDPGGYQWLLDSRPREPGMGGIPVPDYRVGTTIFIYKLSD